MSIGMNANDWQYMQQQHYYGSTKVSQRKYVNNPNKNGKSASKSESKNTCTDGKDDGKIGFFSAIGHAVKGAVKGVVNGIKGCFTNKEGKFSLGKTLLTVAAGAACIAFPPLGVAACAVGVAAGTVKLGKGIYSAATAKTDAQAKDAWENIGDGALTAVTSAVGVKSSLNAVKATSTAGLKNVDDVTNALSKTDDAFNVISKADDLPDALKGCKDASEMAKKISELDNADDIARVAKIFKQNGVDTSKLGNLAQDAGKLDKAKALLKDMGSSTKNQGGVVKAEFGELGNKAKNYKNAKKYNKNSEQIRQYKKKIDDGTITQKEFKDYKELCKKQSQYDQATREKAMDLTSNEAYKENLSRDVKSTKDVLKEAKKSKDKTAIETAQKNYDAAKQAQKESTKFGQMTQKIKEKSNTYQNCSAQKTAAKEALKNTKGIKNKLNVIKENAGSTTFNAIKNGLTDDGRAIYKLLTSTDNGYAQAVNKYGYDNVLHVIETFYGYRMVDEAV